MTLFVVVIFLQRGINDVTHIDWNARVDLSK
jgi:hypothetical protein